MTVPLQAYDDRIETMLQEAVPGSRGVADWMVGSTNSNWWSFTTPMEFNTLKVGGYNSRTKRISYEVFYAVSEQDAGNKGQTRKEINTLLPQIDDYFLTHASMLTDIKGQEHQIPGFIPGSFRAKYLGERIVNKQRGMLYTITFNHKEQVKIKEQ